MGFGTLFLLGTLSTGGLATANPGRQAIGSWAQVSFFQFFFLGTLGTQAATGNPGRQAIGSGV